jgi:hypothetical protein
LTFLIGKSAAYWLVTWRPLHSAPDWNHGVGAKLQNDLLGSIGYKQNLEPKRLSAAEAVEDAISRCTCGDDPLSGL